MGISYIFLLVGFRAVPQDLIESAYLDGAGVWARIWHVMLPMASPQIFFVLFLNIAISFRSFAQIKLLTGGGPANATKNLIYYIYENAIINGRYETACVQAIFLFGLILLFTSLQFALEKMVRALPVSTARTKKRAAEAAGFTIKLALGLVFISPLIIGLFFSFQTEQELMSYPLHLLPQHFTLENYQAVFAKVPLLLYLKNSVIVCVIAIFAQVIFATLAAYAFACFEFPFKKLLFSLVLATTMVPGEVVVVTNYLTIQNMGLTNSYAGLVLPSLISGTAIFLMRQYFLALPKEYKEAATIDGCGEIGYLFRVAMPLAVPTFASLAIYLFVQIYNQFFWPLLVTHENAMRTIQIGIAFLVTGDVISFGQILAGAMIAILPSVLVYILGQDYIIQGMTAGGIKG